MKHPLECKRLRSSQLPMASGKAVLFASWGVLTQVTYFVCFRRLTSLELFVLFICAIRDWLVAIVNTQYEVSNVLAEVILLILLPHKKHKYTVLQHFWFVLLAGVMCKVFPTPFTSVEEGSKFAVIFRRWKGRKNPRWYLILNEEGTVQK